MMNIYPCECQTCGLGIKSLRDNGKLIGVSFSMWFNGKGRKKTFWTSLKYAVSVLLNRDRCRYEVVLSPKEVMNMLDNIVRDRKQSENVIE